jgi:anti-sigma-K factor RskA
MMDHDQASELLASFALDAVDGDECLALEEHLADCPRCRAELDGHREVAAALGNSVEPLPEGLWSNISSRLPDRRDEVPPPMPRLHRDGPFRPEESRAPRWRRSARGPIATVGAIAVAAAAVAAVLGINLVRTDNQVVNLQKNAEASLSPVVTALSTPGHRLVDLQNGGHVSLARFVIVPDGRGYLVSSKLPTLTSKQTYQLWGIVGGQPISLGLLGRSPSLDTFTMAGTSPSKLSVTVEPVGGAVVPSSPIVASGTV